MSKSTICFSSKWTLSESDDRKEKESRSLSLNQSRPTGKRSNHDHPTHTHPLLPVHLQNQIQSFRHLIKQRANHMIHGSADRIDRSDVWNWSTLRVNQVKYKCQVVPKLNSSCIVYLKFKHNMRERLFLLVHTSCVGT